MYLRKATRKDESEGGAGKDGRREDRPIFTSLQQIFLASKSAKEPGMAVAGHIKTAGKESPSLPRGKDRGSTSKVGEITRVNEEKRGVDPRQCYEKDVRCNQGRSGQKGYLKGGAHREGGNSTVW